MTDIFISYSHKDEAWKEALQRHLKVLQSHNAFAIWDDRQIEVGSNWLPAIEGAIEQAKVALLLVSSDFLTSDFVSRKEIPRFLQRREAEGLQVVPVIVHPCAWQAVPWLAALQGGTRDNRPLAQFPLGSFESEQAFSEITLKVYNLLQAAKQEEESKRLADIARIAEQQRLEQERLQRELAQTRLAKEQAEREAAERERQAELQRQHELAEQAKRDQLEREQAAAAERAKAEQVKREQAAAEKAEQERLAQEQAELKRLERTRQKAESGHLGSGTKAQWLWGGIGASALVGAVVWVMQGKQPEIDPPKPSVPEIPAPVVETMPTSDKVAEPIKPAIPLPDMVKIPADSFEMGCSNDKDCENDEKPVRTVEVPAFEMSKTEVTFAQWDACVAEGGCGGYKPDDEKWGRDDHPVINVSWEDAQNYVQWLRKKTGLNYRLPTEAEWEYAARAGTTTSYPWGDKASHEYANYGKDKCCGGFAEGKDEWVHTSPVSRFAPNAWGLQDMHGNVYEWVQDCSYGNYTNAPNDGTSWEDQNCENRVLRGGSWLYTPEILRSTSRLWVSPSKSFNDVGFRISKTL